ncbi:MAG: peptidoglycan DD-metalloendopeptidase family protein [Gammaproteobacteria bacterium]|nr:peptidoglycan DD-metalloendopeptidase family protein [Gammaproteobacteria bacterium]
MVYSGGGLRGYQSLIIVKHDSRWLSAYSFNQPSRVEEGARVKAGEPMADIRGEGSAAVLHFEIRKDGDPVDPRSVIPSG